MTRLDFRQPFPTPFEVERPEKVSMSGMKLLDSCPYSFALYQRYGGGSPSHAMQGGECFHIWAEQFARMLEDSEEFTAPPEVGRDLMGVVIEERVELVLPFHVQDALRQMAYNAASAWTVYPDSVKALETMYELELEGWTFRGKIDRADLQPGGELHIRDWKTSLHIPSEEDVRKDFQLPAYGLLMTEGHAEGKEREQWQEGVKAVIGSQEFPRYRDSETGGLVTRSVEFDHTEIQDFKRVLITHLRRLDTYLGRGAFPAVSGSHCRNCPAAKECPIPEDLREVVPPTGEDEAAELAESHFHAEARNKESFKSLKEYAKDNGPILFGDLALDFKKSQSKTLTDREGLERAIAAYNANGTTFEVDDFYSERVSTRFGKREQTDEEQMEVVT